MRRRALVGVLVLASAVGAVIADAPGSTRAGHRGAANANPTRLSVAARGVPKYRYLFNSGSAPVAVASYGWNLVDVDAKEEADALPAGARGLFWLSDYDNKTCSWELPDAELKKKMSELAGDPKIAGYFFSDEPDPFSCRQAPAEHRARSRLIRTLDPRAFTVMVADSNSGRLTLDQIPLWRGAADYIGLNPYVCYRGKPCDFRWIDKVINAAERSQLTYWGAVQAFVGDEWRWPTAAEERRMLDRWRTSNAQGLMTFAWQWAGHGLRTQPGLLRALSDFNHGKAAVTAGARPAAHQVHQVHYTLRGATAVTFDWVGSGKTIRYGRTSRYGAAVDARTPQPRPFSSHGPFREARLTRLAPGTTYHYSIGGGRDSTFRTAPVAPFRFDVEADVGDSSTSRAVAVTQAQIAADRPAFVIVAGDLTYGNDDGQDAVDRHFDDVGVWSRSAAYMPAWGNHEWDSAADDLRNYKGRFEIPHGAASVGAPRKGCCGEDWGWFDAGGVRFISYPEPYSESTWSDWRAKADAVMAAAQAARRINFIVTFGHRPAYSTGYHAGDGTLASILGSLGARYPKYVLNLNGHSHDYERFKAINGVVHVTAAGGGAELETPWQRTDARTAYRAMHLAHVRVDVTSSRLRLDAVCGPATSHDDVSCRAGAVIDSVTIARRT